MALYFLETTHPTGEKKQHYERVIHEGLDRIERNLNRLRMLRDDPTSMNHEISGDTK
jgi:hypothetical protein